MRYYDDGGTVAPEGYITDQQMRDQAVARMLQNTMGPAPAGSDTSPSLAPRDLGAPSTPPAVGGTSSTPATDMAKSGQSGANGEDQGNPKIVDSHPASKLDSYIQGEEKQVDAFGPEKQAALIQHLQQGYKSPGNLLAKGGATLADAIMQGVARAGSSGNLAAINDREKANLDRTAEMGKSLQEQNLTGIKTKTGFEELSPTTALGASSLPALQAAAKAYGMSPQQVQALAQSNPQAAMKILSEYAGFAGTKMKASIEQDMKMLEMKIQSNLGQQGKNIEATRVKNEALKDTANHPILHPYNAWKANQALAAEGGAGNFSPDVTAYAQKHGISPEEAQSIKDKRTGGQ